MESETYDDRGTVQHFYIWQRNVLFLILFLSKTILPDEFYNYFIGSQNKTLAEILTALIWEEMISLKYLNLGDMVYMSSIVSFFKCCNFIYTGLIHFWIIYP